KPAERPIEEYLAVDPLEIELGVGLIRLADTKRGGDLLARVQRLRQTIAGELGIVMPKVRIRDNVRLEHHGYRIKLADTPVAEGQLQPGMSKTAWEGRPALSMPQAVVEPSAVLAEHLAVVVQEHADEILSRDATRHLLDELKKTSPAVVDELIPGVMK